jgi:hypothetical protein
LVNRSGEYRWPRLGQDFAAFRKQGSAGRAVVMPVDIDVTDDADPADASFDEDAGAR